MCKHSYLLLACVPALVSVAGFGGAAYAAGPDQVQGQGTFHAEGPGSFTDTTIRVNASDSTPGVGTDASGKLSVTDAPSNNVPVNLEADAFCVNAEGNRGVVVGTVTQGPEGTVGRTIFVRITDGGKEKDAVPDTAVFALSTLTPEEALAAGSCATNFVENFPINTGKFTVNDRS